MSMGEPALIVGIGASAGGLAAFKAGFGRIFNPLRPAPRRAIDKVPIELRPKSS